jgi:hypothetical protein
MPRIIPNIDNVPISYSFSNPFRNHDHHQDSVPLKIMRFRFNNTYRYSGFIMPSAVSGKYSYPLGIQEGDYANANTLGNAVPNPANSTIDISFSLAKPNHTRLVITNALGQVVETLIDM